jgi:hypothetical protein
LSDGLLDRLGALLRSRRPWFRLPKQLAMPLHRRQPGAEIHTEVGLAYVHRNTMLTVLRRHVPQLEPAVAGVDNAFESWKTIAQDR